MAIQTLKEVEATGDDVVKDYLILVAKLYLQTAHALQEAERSVPLDDGEATASKDAPGHSMSISIENQQVPCERCRGSTRLAARVPPVGQQPGAKVFVCLSCNHETWQDWRNDLGRDSA